MMDFPEYQVRTLGECLIDSPLQLPFSSAAGIAGYVSDSVRISLTIEQHGNEPVEPRPTMEKAGARAKIFFRPGYTRAAIMTCGGLSPGLNNVIRSLYLQLFYRYGVKTVLGLRDGYRSLSPKYGHQPILLTQDVVDRIHRIPGTILGTSRGKEDPVLAVDTLDREGINILFVIGGDGTLKGAHRIWSEADRRGLKIAIVGVPKTIDNDINFVYKTFGFDTAVEQATKALDCAHTEARSHPHGIGLVKIMGRDSGFVVAYAAAIEPERERHGQGEGRYHLRHQELRHDEEGARLARERGVDYAFHDYKAAGIERAHARRLGAQLGWETLLNRAGTTFRKLPEADQAG